MYRIVLVLLAVFGVCHGQVAAAAENDDLWELLRTEKNLVILMRNAHLDRDSGDPLVWDQTGNCHNETLLSEQGRKYAVNLGELFRKNAVNPIVISSPMCRCKQTAGLAFGEDLVSHPVLREIASADAMRHHAFLQHSARLLAENRSARPIVFISHRPNIAALTFEQISVTELLLGSVGDDGEIEIIGKFEF
jgi:phosphohistidine phosphatase SixA